MIAIVAGLLAIAGFIAGLVMPPKLIDIPNIGLYSAVAGLVACAVGIFSLVGTHTEDVAEHAQLTFIAIISLIAVTLYDTGPLSSPFIILWGGASLLAPLFGLWGVLPTLGVTLGLPMFLAFTGHITYAMAFYAIAAAMLPLILGFILRPGTSTSSESQEDRSYHALAKELSQVAGKADVVIGAIGEGVLAVNGQGVIELINPAAVQIVGWGKEDAVGLNYKSILKLVDSKGDEVSPDHDPVARTFTTNNTTTDNSLSLVTQSGRKLLASVQASPIGQPGSGAIIVFRDITSEKSEEREQAEFISTASHEMRTPVAEIEGYLGLVLNPQTATIDDKARDFVGKAHAAAQHLGRLFQDLLDVSKVEDGRMQNNPKILDVGKFIGDVVESLRPKAEAKGLSLIYQSAAGDTPQRGMARTISPSYYVNADNDHLREIADNLVENAIKYTPHGQVSVSVEGDDQHVRFSISDTGLGIPREDLPHLFQKFYRVDNTQTREIGGTGLGLYLCRRLVESMNGRIWLESTFGQGSTFYIELPRTSGAEASRMIQQAEQSIEQEPTPQEPSTLPSDDLVQAVEASETESQPAVPVVPITPTIATVSTPKATSTPPPAAAPVLSAPANTVTPSTLTAPTIAATPPVITQTAPTPGAYYTPTPTTTAPQPTQGGIPQPITNHPNTPLSTIEQDPRSYISQTQGRALNIPVRNG